MRQRGYLAGLLVGGVCWTTALVGLTVYHMYGGRFYWNVGKSLPPGLYACRPVEEPVCPGTLVLFRPPAALYARAVQAYAGSEVPQQWMKQVLYVEGEALFVVGTHPRSWDSRQFGPIDRAWVQAQCQAVWTWEAK